MYVDCDTFIQHEDISTVFDYLGDNDIIFTRNRPYNAKITKLNDTEEMIYHCGIFVYKKTKNTLSLMLDWYERYLEQVAPGFDPSPYSERVRPWDTFTMWYLLNKTEYKDTIETMNDPAGWNAKVGYYGGKDDPYWHCAGSTSPRQTIGFVIPDKDMWEMMIEDISYA